MPGFEWRQVRADNTDVSPYMRLAYDINRDAAQAWVDTGRTLNNMYTNYKNQQFLRGMAAARDPNDPQSINNFLNNAAQSEQYIGMSNDTLQNALNNQGNVYNQLRREQLDLQRDDIADAQTRAYLAYYNGDAQGLRQAQKEGTDLVNNKNYRSDAFIYNNPYDIEKNQSQLATDAARRGLMGAQAEQARASAGRAWNQTASEQVGYWLLNRYNQLKQVYSEDPTNNANVDKYNVDVMQRAIQEAQAKGMPLPASAIAFFNAHALAPDGTPALSKVAYGGNYTGNALSEEERQLVEQSTPNISEAGNGNPYITRSSGSVWGSASIKQPSSGSTRGNGGEGQSNANVSSGEVDSGIGSKLANESTVQTDSNGSTNLSQQQKETAASQQVNSILNNAVASVNNPIATIQNPNIEQRPQVSSSSGSGTPIVTANTGRPITTGNPSTTPTTIAMPPEFRTTNANTETNANQASEVLGRASTPTEPGNSNASVSSSGSTSTTPPPDVPVISEQNTQPRSSSNSNALNVSSQIQQIAEGLRGLPNDTVVQAISKLRDTQGADFAAQVMQYLYNPEAQNNPAVNRTYPYINQGVQRSLDKAADYIEETYGQTIRTNSLNVNHLAQVNAALESVKNNATQQASELIVGPNSQIGSENLVSLINLTSSDSQVDLIAAANVLGITDSNGNAITSENINQIADASVDTLVDKSVSTLKNGSGERAEMDASDIVGMKNIARKIARSFGGYKNANMIGTLCAYASLTPNSGFIGDDYEFSEDTAMRIATNLKNIHDPTTAVGKSFQELTGIEETFRPYQEAYDGYIQASASFEDAYKRMLNNNNAGNRYLVGMSRTQLEQASVNMRQALGSLVGKTSSLSSDTRKRALGY